MDRPVLASFHETLSIREAPSNNPSCFEVDSNVICRTWQVLDQSGRLGDGVRHGAGLDR
jgi:hypothetical protein